MATQPSWLNLNKKKPAPSWINTSKVKSSPRVTTPLSFDTSSFGTSKGSVQPSTFVNTQKPISFGDTLKATLPERAPTPEQVTGAPLSNTYNSSQPTAGTPYSTTSKSTGVSSFSAPVGLNASASISSTPSALGGQFNDDGTFNPNYTPSSEAEAFQSGVDAYTRQKWLANYYQRQGIDFKPGELPSSFDDEAKDFLKGQEEDKSLLDQQIEQAKESSRRQTRSQKKAIATDLTSGGREGVQSQSNMAAIGDISQAISLDQKAAFDNLDLQRTRLAQLQKEQRRGALVGREDQIRAQMAAVAEAEAAIAEQQTAQREQTMEVIGLLQDSGALANLDDQSLAFLEQGLPGVPPGVVQALGIAATQQQAIESNQQRFDNQVKAIGSMKELAMNGIAMTPEMMMNYSQQTGLPLESVMQFNQMAATVMEDKQLTQAEKMMTIQQKGYELDREARGILTTEAKNADLLIEMYRNGTDPSVIDAFKQAAGLTGTNDPMYQADLAYKEAQATIEWKKANGMPVSIDDEIKLLDLEDKMRYMYGGGPGAYVPNNSVAGLSFSYGEGGLSVSYPPDKEFQCGAFVNRAWDVREFNSPYSSKQAIVNKRGILSQDVTDPVSQIKPGMAFVMPISGSLGQYGHMGLVKEVYSNGTFKTIEANANGKAKTNGVGPGKPNITSRILSIDQMYGFAPPPEGKYQEVGGQQVPLYDKYLEEARANNLPFEEAKKYAEKRATEEMEKGNTAGVGEVSQNTDRVITDPAKMADLELKLSDTFEKYSSEAKKARAQQQKMESSLEEAKRRVENGEGIGAASQGVLVTFQKVLDPTSVVRESEYARSATGLSILEQLDGAATQLQRGGAGVSVESLEQFVELGNRFMEEYAKDQMGYAQRIKNQADSYGLDLSNILTPEDLKLLEGVDSTGSSQYQGVQGIGNWIKDKVNQGSQGYFVPEESAGTTFSYI